MSNPFKITIGAVSTLAFGMSGPAMFCGSFKIDHEYLKEGSGKQLTRGQLGELMLQAMETELLSFEKYLNELRGEDMHLPYGTREDSSTSL